jgi:hypothetical protein
LKNICFIACFCYPKKYIFAPAKAIRSLRKCKVSSKTGAIEFINTDYKEDSSNDKKMLIFLSKKFGDKKIATTFAPAFTKY